MIASPKRLALHVGDSILTIQMSSAAGDANPEPYIVWAWTHDPVILSLNIRPQKCSQFCRQPISKSVIIGDVPIAIREREGKKEQQPRRSWAMPKVLHFSALN
jgi:hypothetical protein